MKKFLPVLALLSLIHCTAHADQLWEWHYNTDEYSAFGTLTTAGNASDYEAVLSITGYHNGALIRGLVPQGGDDFFTYDNLFRATGPHFTFSGIVFDVEGETGHVNLFSYGRDVDLIYFDSYQGPNQKNPIYINEVSGLAVTPAVPEPATWASMLGGLMLLGLSRKRAGNKRNQA